MGDSRIKDVSSLLSSFFDEEKRRRGGQYAEFFGSWRQVAGERLAAHSRVHDIDNGILIIEAEHPGWIQLLQLRQAELLEALHRRFPELGLRGISFRLANEGAAQGHARHSITDPTSQPDDVEPPGPFGPGARAPAPDSTAPPAQGADSQPSDDLVKIRDPALRDLLIELKKTVDGAS